jgi:ParB family transcriptional regulator, chromosome partitioning protein
MGSVLDLFADLTEPAIGSEERKKGHPPQPLLIALTDIQPDPNQPRKEFDPEQIANLAESIRKVGILQPLLLAETSTTPRYQIIEGERRWRAAHLAGLQQVPAYVRCDLSSEQISLAQVIANANRTDLTDFELAIAIQTLLDTQRIKKKEVAVLINKSLSTVSRLLGMLNPEVRPYVEEGLIRHAEVSAIFRSLPEDQMIMLLEQVRTAGTEITTTMVRDLQAGLQNAELHSQGNPSNVTEASINSITDPGEYDPELGAEATAAADNTQNSPAGQPGPAYGQDSAGTDNGAETASSGQCATTETKINRKQETIEIKVSVPDLESFAAFFGSSFEPHGPLQRQPIVIRIPHHYAVAFIEAMGATAPENPAEYANTILELIRQNKF